MSAFSKLTARLDELTGEASSTGRALSEELDRLASGQPEEMDWRRSVVDLLKILELDASYGARKNLAIELGYSEDQILTKGSAEMNLWLIEELKNRLSDGRTAQASS